ncbi:hypothetical protein ABR780_19055 [Bacillus cereus]|uniref:Uncharacterized protein n=1 Tax=Bacillus thuringiensis subsp. darmstadiensis TaxID=132264 RepID=A0A9X6IVI9_BACUD|nr:MULTISPECIES: hypothetical protein [Bacillus cereus group]OUA67890.1 hypothetical protein BK786_08070 [Bacillus thuringiensis serovar thailandensis]ADH10046.1 hypothetical protein BMB171_P0152 [Bacillus thuringiensis BMB171]MEC1632559.1 hypothetical protein [Bacillus paranthracis]OJE19424.1 hypothetical protein BAQ46_23855 [Bacillus paranthracis]OTZ33500.1 hypothetical protein BK761_12725 [Bacillus thuringiensis serovar darmstadiensis]
MIVIDKLDEIEEEYTEKMKEHVEIIVEWLSKGLDLSRLDYIYFPNDFDKAILEFQIEQGISERGVTNNAMGTTFGKTIELEVNGELKDRIFLRKEILLQLLLGEGYAQKLSLNTLHHELCHVHDNNDLAKMFDFQAELDMESDTIYSVLNAHAMNIFSEYIVPKMAVTTKDPNTIIDTNFLADIISYTQKEVKKDIEKYQNGEINIYNFFGELQLKTSHLLKVFSTIIGELDGITKETELINEQLLDSFISNYQISDCWFSLKSALRGLNKTYPNWTQVAEIEPLKKCILKTWNTYGVYPDVYGIKILEN